MPALLVVVISPHRQIWVLVFAAFISIAPGMLGGGRGVLVASSQAAASEPLQAARGLGVH
jgi:hypothetical protein